MLNTQSTQPPSRDEHLVTSAVLNKRNVVFVMETGCGMNFQGKLD